MAEPEQGSGALTQQLPDPALVVLIGPAGAGKSAWAAQHYRAPEIVSSDELRGIVGSGPADLDASADAFDLLDRIVDARLGRGLTTVVDTLGLDAVRRQALLARARAAGLPAVAVTFDTDERLCRERNGRRDRPVPAAVLGEQVRRMRALPEALRDERWDLVHSPVAAPVDAGAADRTERTPDVSEPAAARSPGLDVFLHLSRFPWGEEPAAWITSVALAAAEAGFAGLSLMDHLIQIPQVGRAWEPIPEPWVTLGLIAGLDTGLGLGTLVTPVSFRPAGIVAKAAATLSALNGGRTFVGLGAGWWDREHAAFGVPFAPARERLDSVSASIETMRALWSSGTKAYDGKAVSLPETTCYPRPRSPIPIIVGGGGERRTLRIVAEQADGCNLPSDPEVLARKLKVLGRHCAEVGRDLDDVLVTVLDLPVVGRDRDDVWARVERHRGRVPAPTYAERHHAGTAAQHRDRYARLADLGVSAVFVAVPDLTGPADVHALAALATA